MRWVFYAWRPSSTLSPSVFRTSLDFVGFGLVFVRGKIKDSTKNSRSAG